MNHTLEFTSPSIVADEPMQERYRQPVNASPAFLIGGVPDGTRSLALIAHDADAPLPHGYTHWVLLGIPPSVTYLGEGDGDKLYVPGINDAGARGYLGPNPPAGHGVHRYYFWLYALGVEVAEPCNRREFLVRYANHVIDQERVVGQYERSR